MLDIPHARALHASRRIPRDVPTHTARTHTARTRQQLCVSQRALYVAQHIQTPPRHTKPGEAAMARSITGDTPPVTVKQ